MSRPQVSIDRLTPRRVMTEPRESMNCKSCRKRKIKCNRMRPSCEACKVFQCPCIYDAIPKKRGPKTDVLEALLKRVDGLEKRLQEEKSPVTPTEASSSVKKQEEEPPPSESSMTRSNPIASYQYPLSPTEARYPPLESSSQRRGSSIFQEPYNGYGGPSTGPQQQQPPQSSSVQHFTLPVAVLEAFFSRINGKPFYILDEAVTRQKHQLGQLPLPLAMAIYAITVRYVHPPGGPEGSLRAGLDYALQARRSVDVDNPTIEGLQTLLLLSMVFFAYGFSKKTYMTLSNCSAMILALDLYREASPKSNLSPTERETRRRVFWTCYMMDRFAACGSKRPCLISDHSIVLRLPSWSSQANGLYVEGEIFNNAGPNIQYSSDPRRRGQGATALLIDITRILGITSRYLAAGGVKGDSHFPWHSLSNLSKIRQELDIWAAGTQDMFVSIEALFGHPESTTLLLSKLIYHLVHCLIYRPFLPIDLAELRGTGQHQSWQIEATNLCFLHANAIAELVELGRNSPLIEWPAFISYCVCTAGTVHVHGVHYKGQEGEVFSSSAEFLAKEMQQLSWLRHCWAGVQHQREMLQTIYTCHSELVRSLASSTMRFSPIFHLEDFFDRYPGLTVDGSHIRLVDIMPDWSNDSMSMHPFDRHNLYLSQAMSAPVLPTQRFYQPHQQQYPFNNPSTLPSSDVSNKKQQDRAKNTELSPVSPPNFRFPPQPSQPPSMFSSSNTDFSFPSIQESPRMQNAFSPSLGLSPSGFFSDTPLNIAPTPPANPQYATFPFDAAHQQQQTNASSNGGVTALTPGAQSSGSHATSASDTSEKDPFLSLLEQLAENEQNSQGGPSELDFFLSGDAPDADTVAQAANGDALVGLGEGVNGAESAASPHPPVGDNNTNHDG
ncbi:hypothetical protein VTN77DRAFT_6015 [Rasamsonia byssochlamydoides]|uniref:uncharacterized protein n=1 Tax=Rasamsonia byssochlamydoides TaxID=89139 RepID=UPI003743281D